MDRSSHNRLTERLLSRFPGETLFDCIAQAVCRANCLPRKELYETWEVARRVRRRFRGGRVIDMACGHGLLSYLLLLLDDSSPSAMGIDRCIPNSASRLATSLEETWPRLNGRVKLIQTELETFPLESTDLVVSVHACGDLTDLVLERALAARARVAILPCCHNLQTCDSGGLQGWLDGPLAIDVLRANRLRLGGYRIITQKIPEDITPQNRLLLAEPDKMAFNVIKNLV